MSMPPTPPGHPGPYGQQPPVGGPPGQPPAYPYGTPGAPAAGGPPPRKGGVPVWAWILGAAATVLLLCLCGGIGLITLADDDPTPSESTPVAQSTTTTDPMSTTTPMTTAPTTAPTTTLPTTTPLTTTPPSAVPPTPAGSTPNTDPSRTLAADGVESQIARGMSQFGHTKADISCPSDLVLITGRTTTCTAPVPGGTGRSDVTVEVAWAVNVSTETRYYLTFRQKI